MLLLLFSFDCLHIAYFVPWSLSCFFGYLGRSFFQFLFPTFNLYFMLFLISVPFSYFLFSLIPSLFSLLLIIFSFLSPPFFFLSPFLLSLSFESLFTYFLIFSPFQIFFSPFSSILFLSFSFSSFFLSFSN